MMETKATYTAPASALPSPDAPAADFDDQVWEAAGVAATRAHVLAACSVEAGAGEDLAGWRPGREMAERLRAQYDIPEHVCNRLIFSIAHAVEEVEALIVDHICDQADAWLESQP
jgi:hypothetical protein